jgi:hypothetical protein
MVLNIHQKIMTSLVTVIIIISIYDVLLHLLLGTLHILFESAEYVLDAAIDYLLETGTHETQIIVFYILIAIIGGCFYRIYHFLPRWWHTLKQKLYQHKTETLTQWYALSTISKIAWWSFLLTAGSCWLFLT